MRPHADITLIGHSYGSVVAGLAAASVPSQVKDVVVVGSPGMGALCVADLHTSARVWAGQASKDWIDWINFVPPIQFWGAGHGPMPTTAGFGASVFGTNGVIDHDHYLSPGTQSLSNVVDIVLGRDSLVTGPSFAALPAPPALSAQASG
jgi:pimeloyl-ACP methyl ester carboxylesterase